ncbi:hypothetical protein NEOLEDRAFT_72003 [Neolentinus lepideus HHB14362 ss-1]|uniref:Uncharacterized protein n=1 Tax=Neolentinus lepideus HHB14362 ss-1 TaxID=1314782 RepID=A0A165UC23_9AGAM|nr:hypothetical protein NEOLEDRAFT_72003 [Neolentinus lepideus HHB14362 ss-1]
MRGQHLPFSAATKIIHTMRRQFAFVRRREVDSYTHGQVMYSTPEERTPAVPTFMRYDDPDTRPTPEQIAMGLHLSRTPYLRPLSAAQSVPSGPGTHTPRMYIGYTQRRSRSNRSASPVSLPPPPTLSSLRKAGKPIAIGDTSDSTSPSTPSLSGSTVTSTAPSTARSSRTFFPLKLMGVGMPKFLTDSRASSISDSSSAKYRAALAADSASEDSERPSRRKSVRFTDHTRSS